MLNKDIRDFITKMPLITESQREHGLYTVDVLEKMEVRIDNLSFHSKNSFTLTLPMVTSLCGNYSIDMQFIQSRHRFSGEENDELISCGPSTCDMNKEEINSYIEWLDKFMPRRGETLRDVVNAGNPDNLKLDKETLKLIKR